MRCTSYCTASNFDILRLYQALRKLGSVQLYKDLIYFEAKEESEAKGKAFFFSYGTVVFWNFVAEHELEMLKEIKKFEKEPLSKPELDEFTFTYGETMRIEHDEISLHNKSYLTKLAISHGLAQSVRLTVFEELIQKTINHTKHLPSELARKGKISLSRKEISCKMGKLFIERNFINLHTEILDTPEFFWEHPELEPYYRRTSHYLDIAKRGEILNKRLGVVHELFEILSNELNHQHSSRLEWTIIILIVIEVAIAVFHDILGWI